MNEVLPGPSSGLADGSHRRRPYRLPRLQAFGKLHLRTQGSSGEWRDGASLGSKIPPSPQRK